MGLNPNSGTYRYKDFNNGSICLCNEDGKVISDSEADADSVRKIVFGSNGGGISSKGAIWTGVSQTLGNVESQLTETLKLIKNHWHGDAADQAYAQLSKLRDTANSLSANSGRMGSGLSMMGKAISDTQANYPDIDDDNAAAAWSSLKGGTNDGLSRLPTYVDGDVPHSAYDTYRGPGPGGPGPSLGPGPSIGPGPSVGPGPSIGTPGPNVDGPSVDGPSVDGPSVDGPSYGPSVDGPSVDGPGYGPSTIGPSYGPGYTGGSGLGDGGTGTSLAGFDGGSGGGFGPGGGLAGGAGGLAGSGTGLGGGGLAGGAGGLAGGGSSGAGGSLGVAGGPNIGGVGSAAPGMGGGAGRGGMMGPMMGRPGGGGGDDDERERSTWLNEDDDLWGTSDAPPSVIS